MTMDFTPSPHAALNDVLSLPFEAQPWYWQMLPSSPRLAKNLSAEMYFTGKPCKYGHLAPRNPKDKICSRCRYNAIHDKDSLAYKKRRIATDNWCRRNVDAVNDNRRKRTKLRLESGMTPKYNIETIKEWRKRNPEKWRAIIKARSKHVRMSTPRGSNMALVRDFYQNRPDGHHVDHIIPLRHPLICGLHVIGNLQYLPAAENIRKRNYFDVEAYNDGLRTQSSSPDIYEPDADSGCGAC